MFSLIQITRSVHFLFFMIWQPLAG